MRTLVLYPQQRGNAFESALGHLHERYRVKAKKHPRFLESTSDADLIAREPSLNGTFHTGSHWG